MTPEKRARSLTFTLAAVHPLRIGGRAGDAIAFAEPLQEIAVLAAEAAERRVLRRFGLAAHGASPWGVRHFRHTRPKWEV